MRAGERSQRSGAPANAARTFEAAADLVATSDRARAAQFLERALDAYSALGRLDEVVDAGERARHAYLAEGQERAAARVGAAIGVALSRWRRLADARPYLLEARERLGDEPGPELVGVLAGLAANAVGRGDYDAARTMCDDALRVAQAADVPDAVLADLFGTAGLADLCVLRPMQAEVYLRQAVDLATRAGDLRQQARNLNNLGSAYLLTNPSLAITTARRAMQCCLLSGDQSYLGFAAGTVTEAMLHAGDWREALLESTAPRRRSPNSVRTGSWSTLCSGRCPAMSRPRSGSRPCQRCGRPTT